MLARGGRDRRHSTFPSAIHPSGISHHDAESSRIFWETLQRVLKEGDRGTRYVTLVECIGEAYYDLELVHG